MRTPQLILFTMNALNGMAYSIISPLFPVIGEEFQMSDAVLGYLISTCAFMSFLAAPFIPKFIEKFGRIDLLYASTFTEATCIILYGFFNYIPTYGVLLFTSFTIRAIHGFAAGTVCIMLYSIIQIISSKDEVEEAIGNMEIAWCIGLSAGPLVGSVFYGIGGYTLPFIVLGLSLYISVYLTKIISHEKVNDLEDPEKNKNSILKTIFHPSIILNLGTVTIGILVTTYYFPCLSNHLTQNYNLSVSVAALFFIIGMVVYLIFLQFYKQVRIKLGMHGTPTLGVLMTAVGALLIFPVPPIPQSLIFIVIGLGLAGGAGAPLNIPALMNISIDLKYYDSSLDKNKANDIAATLYSVVNNIGDFAGPTIGGFLSTKYGFDNCCLILSCSFFIYCIIYIIFFFTEIKQEILSGNNIIKEEDEEPKEEGGEPKKQLQMELIS